jgi:hypothetical protein
VITRGACRGLAAAALCFVSACSSPQIAAVHVLAIANEDEEPVPCAILVDQVVQTDASGKLLQTPATVPVTFQKDPTGAYPFRPVTIGVLALVDDHGTLRLPDDAASEAPPYRFADRPVRPSDSKNQLFILVRNFDRKLFRLPKGTRPPSQ